MSAALEIARVNLLRTLRERSSLFFVFILPLILIVALGAVSGGFSSTRLGVVRVDAGALGDDLVAAIEVGELDVDIREADSPGALRAAVEAGELELGLVIPPGYTEALRDGESVEIVFVGRPGSFASALRQSIESAVAGQSGRIRAARLVEAEAGLDFPAALDQATAAEAALPGVDMVVTSLGTAAFPVAAGPFAFGAQSMVVLFMFLTSMTAATQLILTRQLGVSRRMLATPTPVRSILAGELLGRFVVAMMQGLFIVVASSLLFGVAWGDLVASGSVIVIFALIGTGVAMIVGALASNVDQAGALGVVLGMVLGAIGGAMVPPELFEEPITTISRLTPHAWAIDALRDIGFRDAGVADVLLPLAVLLGMAAIVVALGTLALRRALTRA